MLQPGYVAVNIGMNGKLVQALDREVAAQREVALTGRVSRSSVLRDALVKHLASPNAASADSATVAPGRAR